MKMVGLLLEICDMSTPPPLALSENHAIKRGLMLRKHAHPFPDPSCEHCVWRAEERLLCSILLFLMCSFVVVLVLRFSSLREV